MVAMVFFAVLYFLSLYYQIAEGDSEENVLKIKLGFGLDCIYHLIHRDFN